MEAVRTRIRRQSLCELFSSHSQAINLLQGGSRPWRSGLDKWPAILFVRNYPWQSKDKDALSPDSPAMTRTCVCLGTRGRKVQS